MTTGAAVETTAGVAADSGSGEALKRLVRDKPGPFRK